MFFGTHSEPSPDTLVFGASVSFSPPQTTWTLQVTSLPEFLDSVLSAIDCKTKRFALHAAIADIAVKHELGAQGWW